MENSSQLTELSNLADAGGATTPGDTGPITPPLPRTTVVHPISVLVERGIAFDPGETTAVVTADGKLQFLFRDFRRVVFELDQDGNSGVADMRPGIVDDPVELVAVLTGKKPTDHDEIALGDDPDALQDIVPDAGDNQGNSADTGDVQSSGRFFSSADVGDMGDGIAHLDGLGNELLTFGQPEPIKEIAGEEAAAGPEFVLDLPTISLVAQDGSSAVTTTEGVDGAGGETMTYLIRLDEVQNRDIWVHWQTVEMTATSMDFEPQDWWTLVPAGEDEVEIDVLVRDDDLVENTEVFAVEIVNISDEMNGTNIAGEVSQTQNQVHTYIQNDDQVTFSIGGPVLVTEGTDPFAVFTIVQHGELDAGVSASVDYWTNDGTATGGDDFTDILGSLTFTGTGDGATMNVAVPLGDDLLVEDDEDFTLTIDYGHGMDIGTGTIEDNDSASYSVSGPSFVMEGVDLFAVYTVTQTGALDSGITASVSYATTALTATDGADFVGASGILTFTATPSGATQNFSIQIIDDALFESTENFRVEITPNTPNAFVGIGQIDTDILEGGPAPVVQITNASAVEGASMDFSVSLSGPADSAITLNLATTDGDATGGIDFETMSFEVSFDGGLTWAAAGGVNGTEVTFAPGQTNVLVRLDTSDDAIYEGDENFTLRVDSVLGGPVGDFSDTGTGTIVENEAAPTVFVSDAIAEEGEPVVFTISLSGASDEDIVLDLQTTDGSATGGIDFETGNFRYSTDGGTTCQDASGAGGTTVTVPANVTSILVEVETTEDVIFEGGETFGLEVSTVVSGTVTDASDTGTGLISEDETAPDVVISDAVASEGNATVFTVNLSGASAENIVLDILATGVTATAGVDFEATSFRYSLDGGLSWASGGGANGTHVTIPAGGTSVLVEIDTLADALFESTETFTVSVGGVVSGTVGDTTDTGTGTILETTPAPDVTIADAAAAEGSPIVFSVDLSGPSAATVTLDLLATGASATAGTDFEVTDFRYSEDGGLTWQNAGGASGTEITFSSGATNVLVQIDSIADGIYEGDETFNLAVNGVVAGIVGDTSDTALGTIQDNETPPDVTIADTSAAEGSPTVFTVSLSTAADEDIVLDLNAAGVTAFDGADFEITDFRYSTDGGVTWQNAGGAGGTIVSIPAGSTSILVEIDTVNDAIFESNETFTLSVDSVLSGPAGDTSDTGTGTILDNEAAPDVFITDAFASEGDVVVFTVTLSGISSQTISLDMQAVSGTATGGVDFETTNFRYSTDGVTWNAAGGANGTEITIPAGVASVFVEVDTIEDLDFEGDETFTLEVGSVVSGSAGDTSDTGAGIILEDEGAPNVSIGDASGAEGSALQFAVNLSGTSDEAITLDIAATGVSATAVLDFETTSFRYSTDGGGTWQNAGGPSSTQITFGAGETAILVEIDTLNDPAFEGNETFTVQVNSVVAGTVGNTTDTGTGTITDATDVPDVVINSATTAEGSPAVFTVGLSNTSTENVVLDLQATGVSATAGTDFEVTGFRYSTDGGATWLNGGGANGTEVTISAGAANILVEIETLNDAVYEGDETFTVAVNSVVSGTVGSSADTGTVTITDAADIPDVTISDGASAEGAPTVFTVALSNTSFENVVLDLQGTGVSATSGVDFEVTNFRYSTDGGGTWTNGGGANGTQVTIPAGTASILVEIDTLNDAVYEGDETFSLSVNSVVSGTVGSSADTGTGTITDAADIPDVTIGDNTVAEGGLAIVSVDLSNASTEAITLDLGALGVSATGGADFEVANFRTSTDGGATWQNAGGPNGTQITFAAGTTNILVEINTTDDGVFEGNETFNVTVDSVVAGTVGSTADTSTVTITDAADIPDLTIGDAAVTEGTALQFQLDLSNASFENVTLDMQVVSGTATSVIDFENTNFRYSQDGGSTWSNGSGPNGTHVTFAPGTTSILVEVDTVDDFSLELTENMTIQVASVVAGTVGNTSDTGAGTINDNEVASAGDAAGTVDESDLPAGTAPSGPVEVNGSVTLDFGSFSPSITGLTLASSEDGETGTPLAALTSQGRALTITETDLGGGDWSLTADVAVGEPGAGSNVFTIQVNDDGSYSFTLNGALDHPDAGETGTDDPIDLVFNYSASGGPFNDSGNITITVNDDAPQPQNVVNEVAEAGMALTDIIIVLDISGSMSNNPGVPGYATRLELAQAALQTMLSDNGIGNVMVVDFETSAGHSNWGTAAEAITYINGLSAGGGTDYRDAINEVMNNFDTAGNPRPAANPATQVVFISDGLPSANSSLAANNMVDDWESFLAVNNIDSAVAVGVGTGIPAGDPDLADVAWPDDPVIVTDEGALADVLVESLANPLGGNITESIPGGLDSFFGADGQGYISSIDVDGTTYAFDPVLNQVTNMTTSAVTAGSDITITTVLGGVLTFYFADNLAGDTLQGDYLYRPPNVQSDTIETFTYNITDADGDTGSASATVSLLIEDGAYARDDVDFAAFGTVTTGNVITGVDTDTHPGPNYSEYLKADFVNEGAPGFISEVQHEGVVYRLNEAEDTVTVSGQNLVTNGSFEVNTSPDGSFVTGPVLGWQNDGEVQAFKNWGGFGAADGSSWLDLDALGLVDNVYQDVDTSNGQSYEFSFAYSARPGISALSNTVEVYWDGVLIDTIAVDGTGLLAPDWQTYTYTVSGGPGSTTRIEFREPAGAGNDSMGSWIDDVFVGETVTPGAWSYNDVNGQLSLTTTQGATLTIALDGANAGDYSYAAPASGDAAVDEAFQYTLQNQVGDTSDANFIIDLENPGVIIGDASTTEGATAVFQVDLTSAMGTPVVLDLQTVADTATADVDYETTNFRYSTDGGGTWTNAGGVNGTEVTIAAGATSILVEVDTLNDGTVYEGDEYFQLQVASVVSGTLGDTSSIGTATIVDDDPDIRPNVHIFDIDTYEGDAMVFRVHLDMAALDNVALDLNVASVTAGLARFESTNFRYSTDGGVTWINAGGVNGTEVTIATG